jgi:hypothetical protein
MKKILSLIFTFFISFTLISAEGEFTSGNVVIARKGELPGGLFVKAAGYLPGDSVVLSNPETGESLSLLNLGTLDAAEGTALLVSQEAAAKLGLEPSVKLTVKLTGRDGTIDKSSTGSAVLEKASAGNIPRETVSEPENTAEPESDELSYEVDDENSEDDFMSVKNAVEQPSPADEIETPVSNVQEPVETVEETPVEETPVEETPEEEIPEETEPETTVEESFEEPVVEEPFEEELPEVEENVPEDDTDSEESLPAEEEDSTEEEVPEEIQEEKFDADELEPVSENIVETAPAETESSYEPETDVTEDDVNAEEEAVSEEAFEADELEPVDEPVTENLPEENEGIPESDLDGEKVSPEEPVIVQPEENISSEQPVEEDVFVDELPEDLTEDNPEEPVADFGVEEPEPSEEDIIIVPVEEENVVPENSDVPDNDLDGEEVASVEPVLKTVVSENDGVPEDDSEGETVDNVEPVVPEETLDEELTVEEPPVEEEPEDDLPGEEAVVEEPVAEYFEDDPVPENEDEPEADLAGETVADAEPVLPAEPAAEAEDESEEPVEEDSYEGIVLVPAESVIPDDSGEPENDEVYVEEPVQPEPVAEENDIIQRYTVEESDLKKGYYYVQIATVSQRENLEILAVRYSKYPLVFVKTSKGAYRVMVGPLTMDEYGAVLAKFKSFGYRDAFVKSVK